MIYLWKGWGYNVMEIPLQEVLHYVKGLSAVSLYVLSRRCLWHTGWCSKAEERAERIR